MVLTLAFYSAGYFLSFAPPLLVLWLTASAPECYEHDVDSVQWQWKYENLSSLRCGMFVSFCPNHAVRELRKYSRVVFTANHSFSAVERGCMVAHVVVFVEGTRLEQRLGVTPVLPWLTSNHRGMTTASWKSSASRRRRWYVRRVISSKRIVSASKQSVRLWVRSGSNMFTLFNLNELKPSNNYW